MDWGFYSLWPHSKKRLGGRDVLTCLVLSASTEAEWCQSFCWDLG
jgi:hypothetical protein